MRSSIGSSGPLGSPLVDVGLESAGAIDRTDETAAGIQCGVMHKVHVENRPFLVGRCVPRVRFVVPADVYRIAHLTRMGRKYKRITVCDEIQSVVDAATFRRRRSDAVEQSREMVLKEVEAREARRALIHKGRKVDLM